MKVVAVLSMLHERAGRADSASRRFRGEAPLAWTLYRIGRAKKVAESVVLCWEDQSAAVKPIAEELKARVSAPSGRVAIAHLDGVSAARRWEDGWRGGLLQACEFDRGFHGPWVGAIAAEAEADAILLVDPSAGLVDPDLIDGMIAHAEGHWEVDLCFMPAAPGLAGVLLRKGLVKTLAAGGSHPGTLLAYRPDLPMRDPISTLACAPVAAAVARTVHRFTLDSDRQIDRIASATVHLNGQLISTEAEQLVRFLDATPEMAPLPREVTMELTPRRASKAIFSPAAQVKIERGEMELEQAKVAFEELAGADDMRVVFGGVGDPLLHPGFGEIVRCAQQCGIGAMAIETDLIGIDAGKIDELVDLPIDVVSVHIPATTGKTYQAVMGVDALGEVMGNMVRLIQGRLKSGKGTPVIVPTFVKTGANLAEMEAWFDHWIRLLGSSVIAGPGDFAGQIADVSLVQMEPPKRRPCARIGRRMTILSDGSIVACEQDFLGRNVLGKIGEKTIGAAWTGAMASLRRDHAEGNWARHGLCAACKDWHRP